MNANERTDFLLKELQTGRRPVDAAGNVAGQSSRIESTLSQYHVPVDRRPRLIKFSQFFWKVFAGDTDTVYPMIIEHVATTPLWMSDSYLSFLEDCIIDAASVGFASVSFPFFIDEREDVEATTERSFFDVRNLFALRVYLNDILSQQLPKRMLDLAALRDELSTETNPTLQQRLLAKIQVIFGHMPKIDKGKVLYQSLVNPIPRDYTENTRTAHPLYSYSRAKERSLYLPDAERISAMLALGSLLGRAPQSNREATSAVIGTMDERAMVSLFPDLMERDQAVSSEQRTLIEAALGQPYESMRDLFFDQMHQ